MCIRDRFAITPCDEIAKFQNYGFGNLIQDINTEQANSIATNRIANLVATNADITQNSLYIKDINSAGGAVVNTCLLYTSTSASMTISALPAMSSTPSLYVR